MGIISPVQLSQFGPVGAQLIVQARGRGRDSDLPGVPANEPARPMERAPETASGPAGPDRRGRDRIATAQVNDTLTRSRSKGE